MFPYFLTSQPRDYRWSGSEYRHGSLHERPFGQKETRRKAMGGCCRCHNDDVRWLTHLPAGESSSTSDLTSRGDLLCSRELACKVGQIYDVATIA